MPFDFVTIGKVLRQAREERGLTVKQASEVLFLRGSVILALESGDLTVLPPPFYVKGYITQYAKYLQVYDQVAPNLAVEQETSRTPRLGRAEEGITTRVRDRRERPRVRKAILWGSVTVVAVITLFVFLHRQPEIPASPQYETVARSSSDIQPNWPAVNETKKLMIACQERTWVRIVIDDAEKREVMLNPEEVVMFNGREKFDLLVGNAGGIKLFLNGKDTKFEGASGEVKRITLP
jgi:hypothetical protein